MSDPDLFGYAEGRRLRDDGMARADEHASEIWKREMEICLREVASRMLLFTADDVFDLAREKGLSADTHDRRAFGPIMNRAVKAGMVVKEDCAGRPSNRPSLHASPLTVWRSLIVGKVQQ